MSSSNANKVRTVLMLYPTRKIFLLNHNPIIGADEKVIMKKAFELFLSFDDVITHGYRESVTMS